MSKPPETPKFKTLRPMPPDHPFYEFDNVILTPHCAGSSVESSLDSKSRGARNVALVLAGGRAEHIVNPDVLGRNVE